MNHDSEQIKHKVGYKQTKLGWIPEEWAVSPFSSLANIIMGQSPEGTSYNQHGDGLPLINGPTEFTDLFPVKIQWTTQPTKMCREGDVLLCVRGSSTGRINISNDKYCIGRGVAAIRANNGVDQNYLRYQLSNAVSKILKLTAGSTFPNIDSKSLKSIPTCSPPLPEQQKIARILGTWDEAIEKTQKLITLKEQRKKGLMQQLLTGKKRLPGFSGKWEEVPLKRFTERVSRKNDELNDNVVTISAQRGFVRQEDFFNKRVASDTLSGYYLLRRGEFAYNKSYSKGYPMGAFKRLDDFDNAVVTTLYVCFRVLPEADSDFMKHLFEGGLLIKGLMKIAQEGGRAHGLLNIGINDFFNLKLKAPAIDEQKAIAKVLESADKEIDLLKYKLNRLQQQKKGLMQKLLTGQVRVKVAAEAQS